MIISSFLNLINILRILEIYQENDHALKMPIFDICLTCFHAKSPILFVTYTVLIFHVLFYC